MVGQLEGQSLTGSQPLTVREISLGGMAFETRTPFAVGGTHEFLLTLGDESVTRLSGVVRHCRMATSSPLDPVYVVGVQFVDDEAEGESPIGDLIGRAR